ncbi:MAG: Na+/H+ antiporter NhaA [Proteobacteria bacterium]|nr:MAG: Na+/H+ antiporter NhaA [Pseudomonadota bacterium]
MPKALSAIRRFFRLEAASGIILLVASVLAMLAVNSPLKEYYKAFIHFPVQVSAGTLVISYPLEVWINDLLMAIFFLLVGLEIKREVVEGELSSRKRIALPTLAAVGGMLVPALIYAAFNYQDPVTMRGWAIPAATDIAFSLGVLSLLGNRVPIGLKVFLTALAIIDDLGAILVIAIFYTDHLAMQPLLLACGIIAVLIFLNFRGVSSFAPYLWLGAILWVCVLKSGVHATLAGVVLAFTIPIKDSSGESPLEKLEHIIHGWVAFGIVPIFGFANAGVDLSGMTIERLLSPIPLGIALGLFIGKQVGIFAASWIAVKTGLARIPLGSDWKQIYGASIVAGIGFTMSLFIGALAFNTDEHAVYVRLGVILGSVLSAVFGYIFLRLVLPKENST